MGYWVWVEKKEPRIAAALRGRLWIGQKGN